jgi:hypothetical protein
MLDGALAPTSIDREEAAMTLRELSAFVTASILCCCVSTAQSVQLAAAVTTGSQRATMDANGDANGHANDKKKSILKLRADRLSQPENQGPSLDSESDYAGPFDPSNPSSHLICNPQVRRAVDAAWSSSVQAAHRPPTAVNDKVEYGFAINVNDENKSLTIDRMQTSDRTDRRPNELNIPVSEDTIATVHTHNTGARSTPSAADVKSDRPAFVKSQSYIFVTMPGTNHYAAVELNKVCSEN